MTDELRIRGAIARLVERVRPSVKYGARLKGSGHISPEQLLDLDNGAFTGEDFSSRRIAQLLGGTATVRNCSFDGTLIENADFGRDRGASWVDCSFDGARIEYAQGVARFERCSFRDALLKEWWCFGIEMIDCVFTGTLHKVVFHGTVPEEMRKSVRRDRNAFEGNDFSHANLNDVGFRTGIDLENQKLPAGDEYLYLRDARRIVERAKELAEHSEREELRRLLMSVERRLDGGQRQLLLRRGGTSYVRQDDDGALFACLEQAILDFGTT